MLAVSLARRHRAVWDYSALRASPFQGRLSGITAIRDI